MKKLTKIVSVRLTQDSYDRLTDAGNPGEIIRRLIGEWENEIKEVGKVLADLLEIEQKPKTDRPRRYAGRQS